MAKPSNYYLTLFNGISWVGWTCVHIIGWKNLFGMGSSSESTPYSVYQQTITPLVILQSAQWMEMIHTLIGLVKSNLGIQFCQLGGRYNVLILSLLYSHFNSKQVIQTESYLNDYLGNGYLWLLLVWSMAEVIRYPFYIFKLLQMDFKLATIVEWLRYNAFLILYPIGFAGEMRCWWGLMKFLMTGTNINDPDVNYQFGGMTLRGWAMFTFASTPMVGSYVYYGMILARKKHMRAVTKSNKRD